KPVIASADSLHDHERPRAKQSSGCTCWLRQGNVESQDCELDCFARQTRSLIKAIGARNDEARFPLHLVLSINKDTMYCIIKNICKNM
ncbi:MAG: hypothetical protein LBI54_07860, partial [Lachnospiraceae bacterium]|nr:hypothetical protein [Lachnospiraceae bacterium]